VAVSQYFFYKSHPLLGVPDSLTMEEFLPMYLDGGLYFGDYHQHTLDWIAGCHGRVNRDQLLVLRFEDLVDQKVRSVDAIAKHILAVFISIRKLFSGQVRPRDGVQI
jgi:hypothetical protein